MDDRLHGTVAAIRRHRRAVAVAGAVVAVGTATFMTVAVAEAAPAAGTCTDNVNVRSAPKADARIIALCKRGTHVKVGTTKNGFVELPAQHGWAAQRYVDRDNSAEPVEQAGETTAPAADDDESEGAEPGPSRSAGVPQPSVTPQVAPLSDGGTPDDANGADS